MIKTVFLICGGPIRDLDFLKNERERWEPACTICADGGARYMHDLGLSPDLIVGDMDSLDGEMQRAFIQQGSRIIRYPKQKDDTDAKLGLEMAFLMEPDEIRIYGALGARIDHTLANIALLVSAAERGVQARLLDEWCEVFVVRRKAVIQEGVGQTVSLFAFGGDVTGITLEGFEYPLQEATMTPENPVGISNRLIRAQGVIMVNAGNLLVVRYFEPDLFPSGA